MDEKEVNPTQVSTGHLANVIELSFALVKSVAGNDVGTQITDESINDDTLIGYIGTAVINQLRNKS